MMRTVEAMDTTFLTIAEAGKLTGRSASTIRRLIHTITETPAHADRDAVLPSPQEVAAFKKKAENFTWTVRQDVVLKNFNAAQKEEKKSKAEPAGDIFNILQKELNLKNQQIEKQWEVIHSLNDRLREGNMLMGALQKRLSLPEAPSPVESVVDATPVAEKMTTKKASKKEPVAAKKGFFGWLR